MALHHFQHGDFVQSLSFAKSASVILGQGQEIAASLIKEIESITHVSPKSVGILLPLSGPLAAFGKRALAAMSIAFGIPLDVKNQARSTFEKNGITIVVVDSQGESLIAKTAVENLIKQDHVALVIGDITNEAALLPALTCQQRNVPMLSLSRHPTISDVGNNIFAFNTSTQKQIDQLVDHAIAQGIKRFGILFPKHNYGMAMAKSFYDTALKKGGSVTAIEAYETNLVSFSVPARKLLGKFYLETRREYANCTAKHQPKTCLEQLHPDISFEALFLPDYPKKLTPLIPTLIAEGLLVSNRPHDIRAYKAAMKTAHPPIVTLLGPSSWATGLEKTFSQISGAYFVDSVSFEEERLKQFAASFREQTASDATPLDVFAHDAAKLAESIISGYDGPREHARNVYREKIAAFKGTVGLLGPIEFLSSGELNAKEVGFIVVNGKAEPVIAEKNDQT